MQLIRSIVRPNKVDAVKNALERVGVSGITVSEVRDSGHQVVRSQVCRGREYQVTLLPRMVMECVVPDCLTPQAIQAVINTARTGEAGDGHIFVTPVLEAYSIRTGKRDRGFDALTRNSDALLRTS